jgi:hypothetical protein
MLAKPSKHAPTLSLNASNIENRFRKHRAEFLVFRAPACLG